MASYLLHLYIITNTYLKQQFIIYTYLRGMFNLAGLNSHISYQGAKTTHHELKITKSQNQKS